SLLGGSTRSIPPSRWRRRMVKPLRSDRRRGQRRGWLPCPPRLEWLIGGCYSRPARDTEDHPVQSRVVTEVHGRPWKDIKAHGDRPGHSASQAESRAPDDEALRARKPLTTREMRPVTSMRRP